MKHNFKNTILALLPLAMLALASCSDEDAPTPLYHNPANFFTPADTATDATSVLRRGFESKHGSYLLFNDTLQVNYAGLDINGDPIYMCETIDVNYAVGQSLSSDKYTYTYLTTYTDQAKGVEFLEQYVLNHISNQARPFSWMLSRVITGTTVSGKESKPYAVQGERCVCVALEYILQRERSDAQKVNFSQRILSVLIQKIAADHPKQLADFYAISDGYYGITHGFEDSERTAKLADLGFIGVSTSGNFYAPSRDADMNQYSLATITYTDEAFEKLWGQYPKVMRKFKIMKKVLSEVGYIY